MADKKIAAPAGPQTYTVVKTDRQMSIVRFSPCGKMLLAAGRDATIRRWELHPIEKPADADPLATADAKTKKPVKAPPPELPELPALKGHNGWVNGLAFHSDQKRVFSADSWGRMNCWQYADKEPQPLWKIDPAHEGWIRQLVISPDGKTLASCGADQKIRLWSTTDGKKLHEFVGHHEDVYAMAFHPDGKSLVSGDQKGVVKQWDLASGKAVRDFSASVFYRLDRLQDVGGVRSLVFDPAGKTLACAGAKPESGGFVTGVPTIVSIDWASGKVAAPLSVGTNKDVYIHELIFHKDGYYIGVCSGQVGNGNVFFLRPNETQPFFMQKLANCHSVDVHPTGYRIAVIANAGLSGQIASKAKEGEYPGNWSPINILDLPQPTV